MCLAWCVKALHLASASFGSHCAPWPFVCYQEQAINTAAINMVNKVQAPFLGWGALLIAGLGGFFLSFWDPREKFLSAWSCDGKQGDVMYSAETQEAWLTDHTVCVAYGNG